MFLLNQSRQQGQFQSNDRQPNTRAREQAEALFRPKQQIIEPSLPADPALAGASTRRPRVLSASAPPTGDAKAEAPINSAPQIGPELSALQFDYIRRERERLNSRRTELIKQQHELQAKLDVINNEMRAIDAYNAAKNGKSFGASRSKQTRQGAGTTSTRRPEQQRAAAVGNKHAGGRPKGLARSGGRSAGRSPVMKSSSESKRVIDNDQWPAESRSGTLKIPFDNSYARLPERFYARVSPARFPAPRLIRFNRELAASLDLDPDWLQSPDGLDILAGRRVADGSEPIALAYAGHQFGNFVPQLGDGRAILLGEVVAPDGRRFDVQLKGSGRTPFSRGGDGRAALGPVLREYVVSEAMAALGIPTTRALAAVATGEEVIRDGVFPGAVLTRVASSHVRVGTFQYFAALSDTEGVRLLADHVLARHYPEAACTERPYRALLDAVVAAQADLISRWLLVGFIHGVMNTDNMSVAGETIDYGPCAFLDAYDPDKVFSSIDRMGRYAYGAQPRIALWNLTRLAEAVLPLLAEDEGAAVAEAEQALASFRPRFQQAYEAGLMRKLGLLTTREGDVELATDVLGALAENQVDFTLFFRRLADAQVGKAEDEALHSLFQDPARCGALLVRWRERLGQETQDAELRRSAMRAVNPAYIPRNHQIEAMITAAVEQDDFTQMDELLAVLSGPYEDQPEFVRYAQPPQPHEQVKATFCGT